MRADIRSGRILYVFASPLAQALSPASHFIASPPSLLRNAKLTSVPPSPRKWSHPHMNTLTRDQLHNELWLVEQAMIKILGLKPLYFRFPYGEYDDLVLSVLSERGYKSESTSTSASSRTDCALAKVA